MAAPQIYPEPQPVTETPGEVITVMPNGETVPGGGVVTKESAIKFFATKGDSIDRAVEDVKVQQLKTETDGEYLGRWLLTQITFWNRDKERLVILCENAILVCKYDYVAMKLLDVNRIQLKQIKKVENGRFEYPPNSVSMPRLYNGLRIAWGSMEQQSWYQKWNPFNQEIPFTTFTSHPVLTVPDFQSQSVYDVQSFLEALKRAFEKHPGAEFLTNHPIVIESYAGLVSYVHNQSRLGFSRERGGISF